MGVEPHKVPATYRAAMSEPEGRFERAAEEAAEDLVEGFERVVDRALPPHLRARAWARRRAATHFMWRAGVLILGMGLVLAGIAMLVLPGPGWGAIILGLIILASEYAWANRLLEPVRVAARKAARAALDPRTRKRNLIIGAVVLVIAVAVSVWYVANYGVPFTGWFAPA